MKHVEKWAREQYCQQDQTIDQQAFCKGFIEGHAKCREQIIMALEFFDETERISAFTDLVEGLRNFGEQEIPDATTQGQPLR